MATERVGIYPRYHGAVPLDEDGDPIPRALWPKRRRRSWEVRWFGEEQTAAGNRKRYSRTFGRKADAERFAEKKQAQIRSGEADPPPRIGLGEFCQEHRKLSAGSVRATTLAMHCSAMEGLAEVVGWDRQLHTITVKDIERFRARRLERDGVLPSTANKDLKTLKAVLNAAIRRGYVAPGRNPCVGLPMLKTTPKRVAYCPPDEFQALCRCAGDALWRALLLVFYTGALRLEEAMDLIWSDIDFEKGQVLVNRKDAGGWLQAWEPKDHEIRTIPVPAQTIDALAMLQSVAPEECPYVFMDAGRWGFYRDAVSAGSWRRGQHLQNNLLRKFRTRCRQAGVRPYTIHDLRRSCITNWASALPIHVTKELAGHADIRTTEQHYLAVREEDIAKAQRVQAGLVGELIAVDPTDAKVTQSGSNCLFPGRQGCRPKRKVPD